MTSITVKKGPDGTRIDFGGIVDLKSMFKFENNDVNKPLIGTNLPFKLLSRGKVRDTYIIAPGVLLMVATDRISTFDVVLNQGIPGKGEVLNKISQFWLAEIERAGIIRTHSIPGKLIIEPKEVAMVLDGRSSIVSRKIPIMTECIARGYISGSAWKEYRKNGTVTGIKLPDGIIESGRLQHPIFTPSTKSQTGHDQNITFEQLTAEIGREKTSMLKEITLAVYEHAHNYALPRGIIIADTKLEFGINGSEQLVLIDELLTPDSSRFWPSDTYLPGGPQISYDKQYVRDYVESVGWNKSPDNIPVLPEDVIANTSKKYIQAFETLSGSIFRTL